METNSKRQVLPILVAALAIMALATTPAMAKSSQKSHSSAAAAASSLGSVPATPAAPKWGQHDSKPGPAWRTIGGTIKDVEGDVYTIEDFESKRVQMYVGRGTKYLKKKNVGDTVRAEITRGGFANSIQ